jgi:hypothetical protein
VRLLVEVERNREYSKSDGINFCTISAQRTPFLPFLSFLPSCGINNLRRFNGTLAFDSHPRLQEFLRVTTFIEASSKPLKFELLRPLNVETLALRSGLLLRCDPHGELDLAAQ